HVNRQGDVLVITVGDQARSVAVDPAIEPHDLARVVALVIVALDGPPSAGAPVAPLPPPPPPAPTPPLPPEPPPPLPADAPPGEPMPIAAPGATGSTVLFGAGGLVPPPKNWTLRVQVGYERTEWIDTTPVMATMSRRLGPSAHLVVGIGLDKTSVWSLSGTGRQEVSSIPMRAGVELRHRWIAVEAGLAMTRWEDECLGNTFATGGYAAARAYLFPVGAIQNRLFAEAGIRHVTSGICMDWDGVSYENRDTTGQLSVGLELPL
ncbi:MAG: hypothetical protein AB7T06_41025, partial [Kofleriaceae bacterium]